MRAVFLEGRSFASGETLDIEGEKLHHLLNVVRLKKGQKIKLLNGEGSFALGEVSAIDRRSMKIAVEEVKTLNERGRLSVMFALPKKDALEFCLRSCVEIGADKIHIVQSERSQSYDIKDDRIKKIISSGLEQSNNVFAPKIVLGDLEEIHSRQYDFVALASLKKKKTSTLAEGNGLLVVGPEGGFTESEERKILAAKNSLCLNFHGPILRTQTAIPFFAGALSRMNIDA